MQLKKIKIKGIIIIRKTSLHRTYVYNGKIFGGEETFRFKNDIEY